MKILNSPIIITGATGWIGLNILNQLQKLIPSNIFNDRVICFGSKDSQIKSTGYDKNKQIKINIYSLDKIEKLLEGVKKAYIIHSAFLTFEKIKLYGKDNYCKKNKNITEKICKFISLLDESRVVEISSGAANLNKFTYLNRNVDDIKIYGKLKLEEEEKISFFSKEYLILRPHAISGRFVKPLNYAFSQFILCALNRKRIILNSNNNVIRGYVFAEDIANLAISWLFSERPSCSTYISTVSNEISILDLAKIISNIYKLPPPLNSIDFNLPKDYYSSKTEQFTKIMAELNIRITPLEEQITETYNWLKFFKSNYSIPNEI